MAEKAQSDEQRWRRRQRLDAVFGDDLPDTTGDERGDGEGSGRGREWYERNRPPHHG
ncbi:hypothetical protein HUN08_04000 [Gordonia sp. X0973]|uniref:hypothetical protein n=1 Tax=Gordonia sp. X0973 TaxID=2742602 RepID=UPI0013ECA5C4|nr:hypothetical protein [Gordonia sp. X0973]QKT06445.1 hypothetical protein HUN08_04000 [Gordonia sp. X0973]